MAEVQTLTVPAKYVELFQAAAASELEVDTERLLATYKEMASMEDFGHPDAEKYRDEYRETLRPLAETASIMATVLSTPVNESTGDLNLTVSGHAGGLASVLGEMADKIVAPRLQQALNIEPIGEETVTEARDWMAAIEWAIAQVPALDVLGLEELRVRIDAEREAVTA